MVVHARLTAMTLTLSTANDHMNGHIAELRTAVRRFPYRMADLGFTHGLGSSYWLSLRSLCRHHATPTGKGAYINLQPMTPSAKSYRP